MSRFRRLADSYRNRLIVGYVSVAVVFAAAWLWSLYGPLTEAVLSQQKDNLTAVAQAGALVVSQPEADPETVARQLVARTEVRLTVVAADGSVLADSQHEASGMENHAARTEVAAALAGRIGDDRRVSATDGQETLYVAVPASSGGERVALRVSQPLSEIQAIAASSRQVGIVLLLVALGLASAIAVWAGRAASSPVAALSRTAEQMAAGDLSVEVPQVPADLDVLAQALTSLKGQMRMRLDALESEKLTLRSAIDGLTDVVLVLEERSIKLANRSASHLFKTPSGGWRGTDIERSGLPSPVIGMVLARLDRPDTTPVELDPDPTGRTYRLVVAPLERGAATGRTIVVLADITKRARLDRVRRDFVANASHELKTPVSGIRLLAQSVEAAASDGEVEQALIFARQIEAETERLQHLVGDLLDLSRLESAPAPDAIADLRVTVDRAVVSHRAAAARRGLDLTVDLSRVRGVDVYAAADPTDVAIALDNLLDNAIAYTEEGSVTVSVRATDGAVELRVADTGTGIAAEHLSRVFERFYRVDRGRSRESGGTGLGLALVKHVVERSHGTVSVASEPNEGSTFTLRFPRAV